MGFDQNPLRIADVAGIGLCSHFALYAFPPPYGTGSEIDPYLIAKGEKDTDVQEARRMARLFKRRGSDLFANVETKVLVGKEANRKHILDGLRWICNKTSAKDVGVIFISAHGGSDDGKFGIVLAGEESLSGSEIRQELVKAKGKILFMLESCGGGALLTEKSRNEKFPTCVIICASRANEDADTGFGYSILGGLAGKADLDGDGIGNCLAGR
jgi:hypothetical protein